MAKLKLRDTEAKARQLLKGKKLPNINKVEEFYKAGYYDRTDLERLSRQSAMRNATIYSEEVIRIKNTKPIHGKKVKASTTKQEIRDMRDLAEQYNPKEFREKQRARKKEQDAIAKDVRKAIKTIRVDEEIDKLLKEKSNIVSKVKRLEKKEELTATMQDKTHGIIVSSEAIGVNFAKQISGEVLEAIEKEKQEAEEKGRKPRGERWVKNLVNKKVKEKINLLKQAKDIKRSDLRESVEKSLKFKFKEKFSYSKRIEVSDLINRINSYIPHLSINQMVQLESLMNSPSFNYQYYAEDNTSQLGKSDDNFENDRDTFYLNAIIDILENETGLRPNDENTKLEKIKGYEKQEDNPRLLLEGWD